MHFYYISFGDDHQHQIGNNKCTDGNTIARIKAHDYDSACDLTVRLFGKRFCSIYDKLDNWMLQSHLRMIEIKIEIEVLYHKYDG